MDLIKQNKLIGWVIVLLVVLNLSTLTTVWILWDREGAVEKKEGTDVPVKSISLMQSELGLSPEQTKTFQDLQAIYLEKSKPLNDKIEANKLRIADEIFKASPNEKEVDSLSANIGTLQSRIEVIRFEHFRDFVKVLTPEQKEKLNPILRELYARKGPREQSVLPPPQQNNTGSGSQKGTENIRPVGEPKDKPTPPSLDEKVDRYAQRLSLTSEQIAEARNILKSTKEKEESYKSKFNPTPEEFEQEKIKIHKEEDDTIRKILSEKQKIEFELMIKHRIK
jgi:Spy/CpxP family protein refolding chaperone